MEIPKIIQEIALKQGFNKVSYEGELDGTKVFSVGVVTEDGTVVPLGMPTYLLLKDDEVSIISGKEGFDLMFYL